MKFLHINISFFAIVFFSSLNGFSQEEEKENLLPEIQRIQDDYEVSLKIVSTPIVELCEKYIEALNRELKKAQTAGDFNEVVAIKKAVDKFNKGQLLDGHSDSPEVGKLEKIASKQFRLRLEATENPARKAAEKRVIQLNKTLKELTQSGNFESAEKVHNYIKSLPVNYDLMWVKKEINRMFKIPIVQEEKSLLSPSSESDNLKLQISKNDIPEILSVDIEPKKININETFEITMTAKSLHEIDQILYGFQFDGKQGSEFVNVGSSTIKPLEKNKWAISCKIRFVNPFQIGVHELVILTVENKELQKVSNNWFAPRANKPIKITVRD